MSIALEYRWLLSLLDGLSSGKRSDALCYLYDLYPTLCDLMGLDVPVSVTGKSLKPVMEWKTGTDT